jgi:hypothetical protein
MANEDDMFRILAPQLKLMIDSTRLIGPSALCPQLLEAVFPSSRHHGFKIFFAMMGAQ